MSGTSTRPKRRKRPASKKSSGALVTSQRRGEILGLVLMALALLLALALATYSAADENLVRTHSWWQALSPSGVKTANRLGLVGAKLAHALVPQFLGYPTLLLAGLLGAWGYVTFRRRKTVFLPFLSVLGVAAALVAACLFGWFAAGSPSLWSGEMGLGIAGWMRQAFGAPGSLILLLLAASIIVLLLVDLDIQVTLDRLEAFLGRLPGRTRERWDAFLDTRAEHAERVEAKQREKQERKERKRQRLARKKQERKERKSTRPESTRPEAPAKAAPAPPPQPEAPQPEAPPQPAPAPAPPVKKREEAPPKAPREEPTLSIQGPAEDEAGDLGARRRARPDTQDFIPPELDLLDEPDPGAGVDRDEIEDNKQVLLDKLETYNVAITEINAVVGPTVTRYELTPAPGVRISRITALEDDLAMAMAAPGIRILAPIPGKSAIGVEIPNRHRELVRIRSVLGSARFTDARMELPIPLGKSIEGEVHVEDLARMPHLLIAGATGAGKSVGLNAMIVGLLYACHPRDLKFVMIDPKKIELGSYQALHEHYIAMPEGTEEPIITDFREAAGVLRSCEKEMERRYDRLAEAGVRSIREYNQKVAEGELDPDRHKHLPYIVVIIDELADLMMTSGKEVEPPIARLAQMARAVGIHLVLATQRPSVDVITGLIKANFPSRIAFQTSSRIDSRTILDGSGAEQLVGNGDLLYMNGSRITRLQGPFVSNDEIEEVVRHIEAQEGEGAYDLPPLEMEEGGGPGPASGGEDERDDLFEEAARVIVQSQHGSVSLLQRKLSVGYTRAARIVDQLEEAGIVGPSEGSRAREVLVGSLEELEALLGSGADDAVDD